MNLRTLRTTRLVPALATGALLALGLGQVAHAGGGSSAQIALHGSVAAPGATGEARFQDNGAGQRQLEIRVQNAREAAGQQLEVHLIDRAAETEVEREREAEVETEHEAAFGHLQIDAKGNGKLLLQTRNGDPCPQDVKGMRLMLRTAGGRAAEAGDF
jgi:hypothetical protein